MVYCFPSYADMYYMYPSLKKHKLFLPFCYFHRLFSRLFGKRRKNTMHLIKEIINSISNEVNEYELLLKDLSLKLLI